MYYPYQIMELTIDNFKMNFSIMFQFLSDTQNLLAKKLKQIDD